MATCETNCALAAGPRSRLGSALGAVAPTGDVLDTRLWADSGGHQVSSALRPSTQRYGHTRVTVALNGWAHHSQLQAECALLEVSYQGRCQPARPPGRQRS